MFKWMKGKITMCANIGIKNWMTKNKSYFSKNKSKNIHG
jgi:hypothetical protein